jgi:hypothetical protein
MLAALIRALSCVGRVKTVWEGQNIAWGGSKSCGNGKILRREGQNRVGTAKYCVGRFKTVQGRQNIAGGAKTLWGKAKILRGKAKILRGKAAATIISSLYIGLCNS